MISVFGAGSSIGFPFYRVMTMVADELENSGVNGSVVRSDGVLLNMNFFAWHFAIAS
ncbi:MAG: hypothetical protein HC820_09145 [Hydrococcus sp. RM1_1_31]|nr:hypothetical protein [Hydrococcus sp. RM1_1_31]